MAVLSRLAIVQGKPMQLVFIADSAASMCSLIFEQSVLRNLVAMKDSHGGRLHEDMLLRVGAFTGCR
jgi:hypothetical protein